MLAVAALLFSIFCSLALTSLINKYTSASAGYQFEALISVVLSAVFVLAMFDQIIPRKYATIAITVLYAILCVAFFFMLVEFRWEFGQGIIPALFVRSTLLVLGCGVLVVVCWAIERRREKIA